MRIEKTELSKEHKLIINQVISQSKAVEAIYRVAKSDRNLLLIGLPGTGKSMLGRALAEILPPRELYDVISQHNPKDIMNPKIKVISAGDGKKLLSDEAAKVRKLRQHYNLTTLYGILLVIALVLTFNVLAEELTLVEVLFSLLLVITWIMYRKRSSINFLQNTSAFIISQDPEKVPFIDASGSQHHILLGDIRHDPYQSGGLETPPHHLVIPGLIHKANGGVLFIDEIGTLDPLSQFHLLTSMQDRVFPIEGRSEGSSGSVVKTEPVPCNFTLVAAGNFETIDLLHPALRDRIQGFGMEVLMESHFEISSLSDILKIFHQLVKQELDENEKMTIDENSITRLVYFGEVLALKDGFVSLQFRTIGGIIRAARDIALYNDKSSIEEEDIINAYEMQFPVEMQKEQQTLTSDIDTAIKDWDITKCWHQIYDDKFYYHNIQLIENSVESLALTERIVEVLQSKEIKLNYNRLKNISMSGISVLEVDSIPVGIVALLVSYAAELQMDSKTVFVGEFDANLQVKSHEFLASAIHHALNAGFQHIIILTRSDLRKLRLEQVDQHVTIVSSLEELIKQLLKGKGK